MAAEPRLIVFPDGTWNGLKAAVEARYRPAARFGTTQVSERRERDAVNDGVGTGQES